MIYLLDTDICSYIMKRYSPRLVERVSTFPVRELKVSAVSVFELEFGILRSNHPERIRRVVQAFLENIEILPWTTTAAVHAGAIRAELAGRGQPIGAYDLQIAGHAKGLGAILVTHNGREFSRVSNLQWEDWTVA